MNTFLPYSSFLKSALCLDNKRLGKQRVECLQILKALNGETKGWVNHPYVKMWRGYELALILYGQIICSVWKSKGFKDTCYKKISAYKKVFQNSSYYFPFLGNRNFHKNYRKVLLNKNKEHYSKVFNK